MINKIINNNNISNENFSIMNLNIRSISKNLDKLELSLHNINHNFSCIGLTETWLTENNLDLFSLKNYTHISNIRKKKTGGGVSLFIDKNYQYKIRNEFNDINGNYESL